MRPHREVESSDELHRRISRVQLEASAATDALAVVGGERRAQRRRGRPRSGDRRPVEGAGIWIALHVRVQAPAEVEVAVGEVAAVVRTDIGSGEARRQRLSRSGRNLDLDRVHRGAARACRFQNELVTEHGRRGVLLEHDVLVERFGCARRRQRESRNVTGRRQETGCGMGHARRKGDRPAACLEGVWRGNERRNARLWARPRRLSPPEERPEARRRGLPKRLREPSGVHPQVEAVLRALKAPPFVVVGTLGE